VNTVRVIAKLEPGGAQLSMLRVMAELGRRDVASKLLCGWASPEGLELGRRHGLEPQVYGDALERVDLFFAHGPSARDTVIANEFPLERLREGVSPVDGTRSLPIAGLPSPRIVFAGRLHDDKGPDILIEAIALLHDPPPTLILGEGILRAGLQARVRELGLEERVRFLGWVPDPGAYIAGATVLAIPSRDEAFSQTAIIGLAHGVPVIGTEVDGFLATLGDGRGTLVAPEDPQALATAIARVLSGEQPPPPPLRSFTERYEPARAADVYENSYRALLAKLDLAVT
jgi:glycosyltransferase involved in cell wall biosynthesis